MGFERDLQFENFAFKNKYFYPLVIEMIFKKEYYTNYKILSDSFEIIEIIKQQFENRLTTYVISYSQTTLSLLFLIPDEKAMETIDDTIVETNKLFQADGEYITLYFGKGVITNDISGLKGSFSIAYSNINEKLNIVNSQSFTNSHSKLFDYQQELQLTNYLMSGKTSLATELIHDISESLRSVPRNLMKTVFSNIIYTIHKVLSIKQISYNDNGIALDESTYIANICSGTHDAIYKYCVESVEKIDIHSAVQKKKINVVDIIDYIQLHIYDDISLNSLSNQFNTSPQYLSKIIKQHIGVPFHDYISSKRIEKAKELLQNTNKSISTICEEVGFFSRTTFLRTFKNIVGMSPQEYKSKFGNGNN